MNVVPLGPTVGALLFAFFLAVVLVAFRARARERKESAKLDPRDEHELGGRSLSVPVLVGTLFATQYVGFSFIGFAGSAARNGYLFLFAPLIMQAGIVAILVYAPQLFSLSRARRYRTPGDFILDRFGGRPLHVLASLIMIIALLGIILAQLAGIGSMTMIVTDGRADPAYGILVFAILMAGYMHFGGMRAVAGVNLLQGSILLAGALSIICFIELRMGGMGKALARMHEFMPENTDVPTSARTIAWASGTLMFAIAASVYPHTIQRIYAARSESVLKSSLAILAFLPFAAVLPFVLVGIKAQTLAGAFAPLGDFAVPSILRRLLISPAGTWIAAVVVVGVLVAMMSAADSALLTVSSILNRDLAERHVLPGRRSRFYLGIGRAASWIVVLCAGAIATRSLKAGHAAWLIPEIGMELLVQIAPVIWIGARTRALTGGAAFMAVSAGSAVTILCRLFHGGEILRFPAGLWGLALNLAICLPAVGFRPRNRA